MDRITNNRAFSPKIGLALATALTGVALSGCSMSSAAPAETSFEKAQVALEKGQVDKAIGFAEAAVLAEPRNPAFRAMLGAAYLEAGRFDSAATSFDDALALGDKDPRTVLSYALASTAMGDSASARALLKEHEFNINPADLGLAVALAGNPDRGVQILTHTLRSGQNTAKVRQNLAYTYALAGNWAAARVMAMEDVPANQVDNRLTEWAANTRPEDYQTRVAALLNVTANPGDVGQPQHLALSNFPSQQMMVAEAETQFVEDVVAPAVDTVPNTAEALAWTPDAAPAPTAAPPVQAPAPVAKPAPKRVAMKYVSNEVVQKVPARSQRPAPQVAAAPPQPAPAKTSQRRMAIASGDAATHLVQLGSFGSRDVAEAKWNELQRKIPQLKGRDVVITEANVKGKTYYRVAAAGFGSNSARAMCGTAKAKGVGCFAYAASSPPAGAVDRGVRIAAR